MKDENFALIAGITIGLLGGYIGYVVGKTEAAEESRPLNKAVIEKKVENTAIIKKFYAAGRENMTQAVREDISVSYDIRIQNKYRNIKTKQDLAPNL